MAHRDHQSNGKQLVEWHLDWPKEQTMEHWIHWIGEHPTSCYAQAAKFWDHQKTRILCEHVPIILDPQKAGRVPSRSKRSGLQWPKSHRFSGAVASAGAVTGFLEVSMILPSR